MTPALLFILSFTALAADDVLLDALQTELTRTTDAWTGQEGAPYFLSYRVIDGDNVTISARFGQPEPVRASHTRTLDVSARVGSPDRDSTHEVRGSNRFGMNYHRGDSLPLTGEREAIQTVLWASTNKEIRDAQESWARVQADQQVRVANTDNSGDFTVTEGIVDVQPLASLAIDEDAWQNLLVDASSRLNAHSGITWSRAEIQGQAENRYVITSEGTSIRQSRSWYRLSMQTKARAEDGTEIRLYRWTDVADSERLPSTEEVQQWADDLADFTSEVLEAPAGSPYAGPLILRGAAAGVFVHEVLGHRVEGHRQKDDGEGQTFKDKVGETLLPEDISIVDDPTLDTWAGFDLNGHYDYDEEGTAAKPATLVEDGVFKGFLMSRSPIEGFAESNGHGRAQIWRQPVARMANTIVSTSKPVPYDKLRDQLRAEAKAQGREYGLVIDEIGGGFTMTGRIFPNAFNVRATYAYKVFVDGRPDELIRGVDLVGTPLVALSQVVAAGDDPGVFNGFCGAESGSVPNSAVSPSLLIRHLEVQKKEKGSTRPPLLPKPTPEGDA